MENNDELRNHYVYTRKPDGRCPQVRFTKRGWVLMCCPQVVQLAPQVFADCAPDDFGDADVFLDGAQQQGALQFGIQTH